MTPENFVELIEALEKVEEKGVPIDALLQAFRTAHDELLKWIVRYAALADALYPRGEAVKVNEVYKKPFRYEPEGQVVFDSTDQLVLDVRGWGRLTGRGHGALGLPEKEAMELQDAFGRHVANLLNLHL